MNPPIDLSIVIPAYREADRIDRSMRELAAFLNSRSFGAVEILIMAQSDDDTGAAAAVDAKLFDHFKVVNLGKRMGKGGAVRAGMLMATGRYRLFMDADLATPLSHLDDVYQLMQQQVKVAIAVRNLWSIHKGLLRKLISKSSNIAAQLMLLPGIKDTQCGFKIFEATAADRIFSRQTMLSWSFDVEILVIAKRLGYRIHFIQVADWKDPKILGLVGDSAAKAAIKGFADLITIRLNTWKGVYKHRSYDPQVAES